MEEFEEAMSLYRDILSSAYVVRWDNGWGHARFPYTDRDWNRALDRAHNLAAKLSDQGKGPIIVGCEITKVVSTFK